MNDHLLNSDPRAMAFGRYLKSMRMQMKIPIEAVADEMRISVGQLALIEAEDHRQLPDKVYVKGLLRSYARCIGVDGDDVVDRYVVNRSLYDGNKKSAGSRFGYGKRNLSLWVLFAGLFILAVMMSTYMRYGFTADSLHDTGEKNSKIDVNKDFQAERDVFSFPAPAGTNDRLFLQIDAIQETWLKMIIDDAAPVEYLLHPMDHMELEASSEIKMRIGNAAGVKILLNEQPVSISGKSGEVVNIELPQSD